MIIREVYAYDGDEMLCSIGGLTTREDTDTAVEYVKEQVPYWDKILVKSEWIGGGNRNGMVEVEIIR